MTLGRFPLPPGPSKAELPPGWQLISDLWHFCGWILSAASCLDFQPTQRRCPSCAGRYALADLSQPSPSENRPGDVEGVCPFSWTPPSEAAGSCVFLSIPLMCVRRLKVSDLGLAPPSVGACPWVARGPPTAGSPGSSQMAHGQAVPGRRWHLRAGLDPGGQAFRGILLSPAAGRPGGGRGVLREGDLLSQPSTAAAFGLSEVRFVPL